MRPFVKFGVVASPPPIIDCRNPRLSLVEWAPRGADRRAGPTDPTTAPIGPFRRVEPARAPCYGIRRGGATGERAPRLVDRTRSFRDDDSTWSPTGARGKTCREVSSPPRGLVRPVIRAVGPPPPPPRYGCHICANRGPPPPGRPPRPPRPAAPRPGGPRRPRLRRNTSPRLLRRGKIGERARKLSCRVRRPGGAAILAGSHSDFSRFSVRAGWGGAGPGRAQSQSVLGAVRIAIASLLPIGLRCARLPFYSLRECRFDARGGW